MGYTFTANSTGLGTPTGNAVSSPFAVTAGSPSRLAFVQQPPVIVTGGAPVAPAVTVQLLDAAGNAAPQLGVAVGLTMSGGGALNNASATTNRSGLATFAGLTVTATAGVGYRLTANATGLGPATSNAFVVIPMIPTHLGFLTQPGSNTKAGKAMSPPVEVEVLDANGIRVTTVTVTVTLTLGSNQNGANLTGNVVTTSGGVAVFPNLKVSQSGTGYTLVATSLGLAGVTSISFRIR